MVTIAELFALGKAYPIISIIVALILFFIGFKITAKLFKWILWVIAVAAVVAAIIMFVS